SPVPARTSARPRCLYGPRPARRAPACPYTSLFRSSEVWSGLRRNCSIVVSVGLVTFVSLLFVGARPASAAGSRHRRRAGRRRTRSEEHTSELQSRFDLVCRLLPEKKA